MVSGAEDTVLGGERGYPADGEVNGVNGGLQNGIQHANGVKADEVDEAFIRSAVDKSAINALRMALYQMTGDPDLATMKITKEKIRGGALYDYVLSTEDEQIVKDKATEYLLKGPHTTPPPPSVSEARKLMNLFGGRMIADNDVLPGYEELCYDEFPRGVDWTKDAPPPPKEIITSHKVVIIGAGLSGIAAAIQLKRLGIPYVVIERQENLGGTWLWNSYPECRVDTLSYLFQYKFEKNYKWPEFFAARQDTLNYLEHVAAKYGVKEDFQFNKEVVAAVWDEASSSWQLKVKNKKTGVEEDLAANSVISAAGLFSVPNLPDIPGITDYKGHMFHTTEWDHSVDYKGLRIAVIGTGSTGAQLIPNMARAAKSLAIYQRTPNWIVTIDGYRAPVPSNLNWMFDNMPYYWNWYCYAAYFRSLDLAAIQVRDPAYEAKGGCINERNDGVREALTNYIHKKMAAKPELIPKLVPKYAPLIRRLVMDNGFYDALLQDNTELVTDGIEKITEKGIITKDGKEREFDLIVLAGGFKTSKYFFPINYVGRKGRKLDDLWSKDGARSYLGMVMPGFPNLFSLYGPNHQPRGGSLYSWAEIWARYAVASVVWMIENKAKSMDVRPEVYEDYQSRLDAEVKKLIWESPEGASYYVNEYGRSGVNMPWTTSEYHEMVIKPNPEDFNIS
ncbi:FAD dependent oxidoreductase [Lepidopterella palustris CBS 459.81]|uniref:FAD dependent oxidoreductase n=1 Tax=Lepidopterella palustris CBS 459.81 TaxID=1314670 RepID=A0A8E2DW65_9PEZI|nr:FAD dependent oxidoreductase [Lepidopterella palustris CBS 459.81]